PEIAVLTHTGSAHLENFNSKSDLIQEKSKLFQNVKKIIYNSENELTNRFIQENYSDTKFQLFSFGKNKNDTIQILKIDETQSGKLILIHHKNQNYSFPIPFHDAASVENILTVLTAISAVGLDLENYLPLTQNLMPIEMRLEIKEAIRDSIVINDSFNSDLHSVKVALDVLAQQPFPRKSLVLTAVLQSNLNKDELYWKVWELVNSYELNDSILIGGFISIYKNLFYTDARIFS